MIATYVSFNEMIAKEVRPLAHQHRLDGQLSGPNGTGFARFYREGRLWQLNADSLVAPLLRAADILVDPFVLGETPGGRKALRLRPELRSSNGIEAYIYEYPHRSRIKERFWSRVQAR